MLKKTFASFCVLLAVLLAWPIAQGESPLELGLDLAGGTMVTYRPDLDHVPEHSAGLPDAELLNLAKQTLAGRLAQRFDTLPDVVIRGDQRIVVSLPVQQDQRRVLETLGETYRLSFRRALAIHDVEPTHSQGWAARYQGRWLDLGEEVASGDMLDPRSIRVVSPDARNLEHLADGVTISFEFLPPFDDLFAEITAENVGGTLAILLDDEVEWAGVVSEEIRGPGMLRGGYDLAEASEVASLLRSGNLPLGLDMESMRSVGPTRGEELQERGGLAVAWSAAALVAILALAYGRRPALFVTGLVSLASLLFFTVGLISLFGLTVDLIAIAGLVLSIGMGMDAFILVFEALESRSGAANARSPLSPLGHLRRIYGFRGEGRTLVHANATTLLVVLLLFASERLQSFALFLIVGMMASLLTLGVSRWTLMSFARRGWLEEDGRSHSRHELLAPLGLLRRFRPRIFRWRKVYFAVVGLVLLTSAVLIQTGQAGSLRLGSDFQPGVQIQLATSTDQIGPLVDDLRGAFPETSVRHQTVSIQAEALTTGSGESETYLVTLEGPDWSGCALADLGHFLDRRGTEPESMQSIDARLSARRTLVSLSALVLSFVFLGVYLGPIRRWIDRRLLGSADETGRSGRASFLGTVLAVLLDVALVLVTLAWLRIPLGLPELAAVLTIVGYSVNDSMVLFSHLTQPGSRRSDETPLQHVERVVDRILVRALLTSVSTTVPALAILAVGLEPLAGFAWAVVVGTVSGTLSSLFVVASFVARSWSHGDAIPETIRP